MGIQLERLLPALNFRIDTSTDLERFVNEVLQPVLDLLCAESERWVEQQDIDTMDDKSINATLRDLGNPFEVAFTQPLNRKRLLARALVDLYKGRGTKPVLVDVLFALANIEVVDCIVPASVSGWILGEHVLGGAGDVVPPPADLTDLAILAPSAQFLLYSFQLEVPSALTAEQEEIGTAIVDLAKPAHTHFMGFVVTGALAPVLDHWELGLSALHDTGEPVLGDEADLHD